MLRHWTLCPHIIQRPLFVVPFIRSLASVFLLSCEFGCASFRNSSYFIRYTYICVCQSAFVSYISVDTNGGCVGEKILERYSDLYGLKTVQVNAHTQFNKLEQRSKLIGWVVNVCVWAHTKVSHISCTITHIFSKCSYYTHSCLNVCRLFHRIYQ